jgi:SSS family transporter
MPILAAFGPWDWAVLGAYLLLMLVIGVVASLREKGTAEFFLGGRSLPTWALAISIVGSSLSAVTFIGAPDAAYVGNLSYLVLNLGGFIGVFIVGFLFVPKLYRAGTVTIYGYLEQRFGQTSRMAVSVMFLFGRMLASGSRLMLAAFPLCLLVFGLQQPEKWQLMAAILCVGFMGTFYTIFGGIRTVIWVDTIQFALVVGAAVLTIAVLVNKIPASVPEIVSVLSESGTAKDGGSKLRLVDLSTDPTKPYTLWTALFGAVFLSVASLGVDQDLAQRFLVARSPVRGAMSVIASQFVSLAVVSLFVIIGVLLYIYYRRPDVMGALAPQYMPGENQAAYQQFLLMELPPVVSGLAIAGLFASAQGTMDSAINAMASSLVADLYWPVRQRLGRPVDPNAPANAGKIAVAVIGAVMTAFAIACVYFYDPKQKSFLDFALGVMTFAFSGMLGVFLTALLTKRGSTTSVLAALIAGIVVITLLQDGPMSRWTGWLLGAPMRLAWPWWMPIGTAVTFVTCVAGSPSRRRERISTPPQTPSPELAAPDPPSASSHQSASAIPTGSGNE